MVYNAVNQIGSRSSVILRYADLAAGTACERADLAVFMGRREYIEWEICYELIGTKAGIIWANDVNRDSGSGMARFWNQIKLGKRDDDALFEYKSSARHLGPGIVLLIRSWACKKGHSMGCYKPGAIEV